MTYVTGQTDQTGAWKSQTLAPGSYYLLATNTAPDHSPEAIAKLPASRTRLDPVDIAPDATVDVTVEEHSE